VTFLWAMGVVNYGTGIHHHKLYNWIIILGDSGLIDFLLRQFRKKSSTFKTTKKGSLN